MPNTFSPWVFPEIPDLGGYGLGWVIRLYRGRKICYHHGEIEGYCSLQAVVPDLGRGDRDDGKPSLLLPRFFLYHIVFRTGSDDGCRRRSGSFFLV